MHLLSRSLWFYVVQLSLGKFPCPSLIALHGAHDAGGIGALNGDSVRNKQTCHLGDSGDLSLPVCGQVDTSLPFCLYFLSFSKSLCAPSCLTEYWWGWTQNVVHRLPGRREQHLLLLAPGAKTSMWIWQHHLSKKKKKRSTEEVALAVKETTENLSNWNIRES